MNAGKIAAIIGGIVGALLVLASAVWRIASWRRARAEAGAEETRVEGNLALAYAGCVLALVLYFLSTDAGISLLRLDFANAVSRGRYHTALQVLWVIVLTISLLPALVAAVAPGIRRGVGAGGLLEAARIRDAFNAGLVIALAGTLLFVVGFVASRQDRSVDLGYFRTSPPGTATTALARSLRGGLHVVLFFPDASLVKRELEDYFQKLARTGVNVRIESHDPLLDPDAARRYDVTRNGSVLLEGNGTRQGTLYAVDLGEARKSLRVLDQEIQHRLIQLVRGRRVAYVTVGHGELNDTVTSEPYQDPNSKRLGGVDALRSLLAMMNYEIRDLSLTSGLGKDVPSDVSMVLVLGPRRSFLSEELAALDRYSARGGSLLLALQPRSAFRLGPLEQRLGLRFDGLPLADDQQYIRQNGDVSDRGLLVSNQFRFHPAVKTAALSDSNGIALFPDPGHLVADSTVAKPTILARTLPSAFLDRNGNFLPDGADEKRGSYDLAAAVQADSARALVYADAEMFTDAVLPNLRINASLAADGVRWLGREEAFAGTTASEEDVPIQHTRARDVTWFYSTILGAPALVLAFGLVSVRRRRRTGRQA